MSHEAGLPSCPGIPGSLSSLPTLAFLCAGPLHSLSYILVVFPSHIPVFLTPEPLPCHLAHSHSAPPFPPFIFPPQNLRLLTKYGLSLVFLKGRDLSVWFIVYPCCLQKQINARGVGCLLWVVQGPQERPVSTSELPLSTV